LARPRTPSGVAALSPTRDVASPPLGELMPKIRLKVPTVAQEKPNSCWHASASMIWSYWQSQTGRQGPMFTVPDAYARADTVGLYPTEFITLAKNVGLKPLPLSNQLTEADLFRDLRDSGPIWCAGYWFGVGHIIVLTGVGGGRIQFNDPDGGVEKEDTLAWFNQKLASGIAGCRMVKDAQRY
ncbi:MAG: C39 family peptidase, partial [Planctomycetes bacterium]|nr:C39 family peptidase [Planctomycetota bacterium]